MSTDSSRLTIEVDVTPTWWNGEEQRIALAVATALSEAARLGAVREVRAERERLRLVLEVAADDSPAGTAIVRLAQRIRARLEEVRWPGPRPVIRVLRAALP